MHSQNKSLSILSECTGFAGKRQGYNRKNFIWNVAPLPVAKPLLLIVDDDSVFCGVLSKAMTKRGFSVACAHTIDDALGLAKLLVSVGAKRVQLLPFHQFGEKKYDLLNKEYTLKTYRAYHEEDLKDYQQIFLDKGIDCFF